MSTNFKPRTTAPAVNNKYYIKNTKGGYNKAMAIDSEGHTLPNCCGLVHGRWLECTESTNLAQDKLCLGNAVNYYKYTKDGFKRGQTPKLGAVACFSSTHNKDGHVATVEQINKDGSIVLSNSAYKGKRFYTMTVKPPYNHGSLVLQGFIYNPYVIEEEPTPSPGTDLIEGVKVQITGPGNSRADGKGKTATSRAYKRYILKIYKGRPYPYQVGNDKGTLGFYPAASLKKI